MMRLAVSNLAWPTALDAAAFRALADLGVEGIEVAPTRLAPWDALSPALLAAYRARLTDAGLTVSSLQAILFGRDDAALLGDARAFGVLRDHIARVAEIGAALGASVAVFGSPRNRALGGMTMEAAWPLARDRWAELAAIVEPAGMAIGIEPVPAFYGGEFLASWQDVLAMVGAVDRLGIRVHLDTGCVSLGGGQIEAAIPACLPYLAHFHAAQPNLAGFDEPAPNHADAAVALRAGGYGGWVAIEMREQPEDPLAATVRAMRAVTEIYGFRG